MSIKAGDRIEIVSSEGLSIVTGKLFFESGDKATLKRQDADGDWWAEFDDRDWGFVGDPTDREFCLQKGITKFKVI
jgi:hypothetical protein